MNYWHMQLHPGDQWSFPPDIVENILIEKNVIGLGANNSNVDNFINRMTIGDIVLIKSGVVPIALVKVKGDAKNIGDAAN